MRRILLSLAALTVLALPASAQATTIVVNTTAPVAASPACGLADAIVASNLDVTSGGCPAGSGSDRIEFALPAPATISLSAQLQITNNSNVEIVGPGASQLTVSGGDAVRVFEVSSGVASISDLTIAEGKTDELGAGLIVRPTATAELLRVTVRDSRTVGENPIAEGGGIGNEGTLTLVESTVSGNTAENTSIETGREAVGAGIGSNGGTVLVERSTISGNTATLAASSGASNAGGAGIFTTLSTLTVRDSTISGNQATATGSNLAVGAGIFLEPFGPQQTTIEGSTIAGNTATGATSQGGGLAGRTATATVASSTIAGNSSALGSNAFFEGGTTGFASTIVARPLGGGADCATIGGGTVSSAGYNLDEGSSCGFANVGDQSNVNPLLAPALAANGGPTETLALLNGSPAVDRGVAATGEIVDQRGFKRPVEIPSVPNAADGTDVGAFEVQVPRALITRGPGNGETIADAEPSFDFAAEGAATGFVCSFDGASPTACTSPFKAAALGNGSHTFTVAALGEAGYAGEAASRTFTVDVRAPEKPVTPVKPPEEVKQVAPRASITGGLPARTTKRRLSIRFSANEAGSRFQCKLDKRKWRGCRSPYKTPKLAFGKHVFKLKAIGPTGLVREKPTTKSFRVVEG